MVDCIYNRELLASNLCQGKNQSESNILFLSIMSSEKAGIVPGLG
jgi:hypothetical protein